MPDDHKDYRLESMSRRELMLEISNLESKLMLTTRALFRIKKMDAQPIAAEVAEECIERIQKGKG